MLPRILSTNSGSINWTSRILRFSGMPRKTHVGVAGRQGRLPFAAAHPIDDPERHKLKRSGSLNSQGLLRISGRRCRLALPLILSMTGQCPAPPVAADSGDEFGKHKLDFPNSANPQASLRIIGLLCRLVLPLILSTTGQCPVPSAAAGSIDDCRPKRGAARKLNTQ